MSSEFETKTARGTLGAGAFIASAVARYRGVAIRGRTVDLVPYGPRHHERVVVLRNLAAAREYMNLGFDATLETQQRWYESYRTRQDDIYWVLSGKKDAEIVGTTRIYDMTVDQVEKGSLIVDPRMARLGPFALEAELLLIKFVFDELGIPKIVTAIATDNHNMLSINSRFGFVPAGRRDIRGKDYLVFELQRGQFDSRKLDAIVDHWSTRHEH